MGSSVAEALLGELDPLPYQQRMTLLARSAMALADSGGLEQVLDELYDSDRFCRETAVFMAGVVRHEPTIVAALTDEDPVVQGIALKHWLFRAPPDRIAELLMDAPWRVRRRVYRRLRSAAGPEVADALIDAVWQRFGDAEAARLLPVCSPANVARLLPELGYMVTNWTTLGRRHPNVVIDVADGQLAELTSRDRTRWWRRHGAGVLAAAPAEPIRVLKLLEEYAPADWLPGSLPHYRAVAAADIGRLVALFAAPSRARWLAHTSLPGSFSRQLAAADTAMLVPLARRLREYEGALADLLAPLPPSRRAALYDAAYSDTDRGQVIPSDDILEALPRVRRHVEVDRVLRLPTVRADDAMTLRYTAFLPWARAKDALIEATTRADAQDRAAAYELLIRCAARTAKPAVVAEAVERLRRTANEQDPVRARALVALTRVSPRLFTPAIADALDRITQDTLAARDASRRTRTALHTLAIAILRHHYDSPPLLAWSQRTLERLFGHDMSSLGRLDTELRRGQEADVFAAVGDWLAAGVRRGDYTPLFEFARALGRRAFGMPALQDMLRDAIDPGNVDGVVRQAVALWLADPAERGERVEWILDVDSSTATLPEVWSVLCHRRTDLLDLVLGDTSPRNMLRRKRRSVPHGKFLARGVQWVPWVGDVRRWLPRQQAAYAGLLAEIAGDPSAKVYARTGSIAAAARIPELGWEVVAPYLVDADVALAEAALAALAWTDRPTEALPILLGHCDDDRARVTMYAARRVAAAVRPSLLRPILAADGLRDAKVTSRKEVVRIASALSVPDVGTLLADVWAEDSLHPDVAAAVVGAARRRMHDDTSWSILSDAAIGCPEEVAALVAMDPFDCAPRYRVRYGGLVVRSCRGVDQQLAGAAWAAMANWAPWASKLGELVAATLADLRDQGRWRCAVPAFAALLDTGRSGTLLLDVVGRLAASDAPEYDEPGRDRPARRRLRVVVDAAVRWGTAAEPDCDRTPLIEASRWLCRRPDLTIDGAALRLAALVLSDDEDVAGVLSNVCFLVVDQPVTAARLADTLARRVAVDQRITPGAILAAAAVLADDGRLSTGLFALALAGYGKRLGWPPAWRAQIDGLRAHPQPDIRAAAFDVVMGAEMGAEMDC